MKLMNLSCAGYHILILTDFLQTVIFSKKITSSELAEQFKTLQNRLLINQLTVKLMFDAAAYRGAA